MAANLGNVRRLPAHRTAKTQLRLISREPCLETVAVIRSIPRKALQGDTRGLALCCRGADGGMEVWLTGSLRADPDYALAAAERIRVCASHQLDLYA